MKYRIKFFSVVVGVLVLSNILAQEKKIHLGIGYRVGLSQNSKYDGIDGTNNLAINTSILSYSNAIYTLVNFRKDNEEHFFQDLKLSVSWSERSGIFDIDGINQKVKFGFMEVEGLAPLRIKVSEEIYLSLGIGANISFRMLQTKGTPNSNILQPGPVFEMGLITRNGSCFGFHLLNTFADYPLSNIGFNIGVTQNELSDSFRKMRRQKN